MRGWIGLASVSAMISYPLRPHQARETIMHHEDAMLRATASTQPQFDFTGEWTNARGSSISLVEEAGVLIGVFQSADGPDGEPVSGQLSGQAQGDLIAFTVKWPQNALTAWVGHHRPEDDKDVIDALWQMTTIDEDSGRSSTLTGADRFERSRDRQVGSRLQELEADASVDAGLAPTGPA